MQTLLQRVVLFGWHVQQQYRTVAIALLPPSPTPPPPMPPRPRPRQHTLRSLTSSHRGSAGEGGATRYLNVARPMLQ
eukprot:scaffold8931_cov65-Phaeocystis_antarctica.AAC.3